MLVAKYGNVYISNYIITPPNSTRFHVQKRGFPFYFLLTKNHPYFQFGLFFVISYYNAVQSRFHKPCLLFFFVFYKLSSLVGLEYSRPAADNNVTSSCCLVLRHFGTISIDCIFLLPSDTWVGQHCVFHVACMQLLSI